MSSLEGTFDVAPRAMVAVLCAQSRNFLHLHTARGPPIIGAYAQLAFEGCDVATFASPQVALSPLSQANDIFGNEPGSVIRMVDSTLLHNWAVRAIFTDCSQMLMQ